MGNDRNITIIGGGIAGLATATALAMRGASVEVLEQAPEISEVGAGIQISPNGAAVIDALGLGVEARGRAIKAGGVTMRDYRHGNQIIRLDLGRYAPDRDFLLFHRADLIDVLLRGATEAGVTVRTGAEVTEITDGADAATIDLADGTSIRTSLAIGADGLHSRLRARLNRDADPFFTGQVAWRALVPADAAGENEIQVYLGPGRHLVTYPLRGGQLRNIVAVEERGKWADEGWNHVGNPDGMRRAFAGFCPEVRALLEPVTSVFVWGLFRHPVATRWHGQRTVLVGDAAHPTLPFLAQGANMALEDAWVLAELLSNQDRADALSTYQARRAPRVSRVIAAANANARNYHLRNPLLRRGAHGVLRMAGAVAPATVLGRFDWIYGHDVTETRPAGG